MKRVYLRAYITFCLAVGLVKPLIAQTPDKAPVKNTWKEIEVADSLKDIQDENNDSAKMLKELSYESGKFKARIQNDTGETNRWILFPSPKPSGDQVIDTVHMEWYPARNKDGKIIKAPAVLVLHSIHPRLFAGRAVAKGLARQGLHAFVVQAPFYAQRRPDRARDPKEFVNHCIQWVADARRAYDVINRLPEIEGKIHLQGTSLGGYAAAALGAMDDSFDKVFISLAGVNLIKVLEEGRRDAKYVKQFLARGGLTGEKLASEINRIEPARIAHRLPKNNTWLFNGRVDQVVPKDNALKLAEIIKLAPDHHIWYPADHYTAFFYFPKMILQISDIIKKPIVDDPQKVDDTAEMND